MKYSLSGKKLGSFRACAKMVDLSNFVAIAEELV
jgi:hypothetical protein